MVRLYLKAFTLRRTWRSFLGINDLIDSTYVPNQASSWVPKIRKSSLRNRYGYSSLQRCFIGTPGSISFPFQTKSRSPLWSFLEAICIDMIWCSRRSKLSYSRSTFSISSNTGFLLQSVGSSSSNLRDIRRYFATSSPSLSSSSMSLSLSSRQTSSS